MNIYATGIYFGEGPRWHDGALWMSDPQTSRLYTDASGTWSATELESTSNGLWFLPDGQMVGAIMHEKRIGKWRDDHWETYVDLADIANGPLGDMTGDSAGNLYVDDVGYYFGREDPRPGRLLLIGADRSVRVAIEDLEFPNGLALTDGGRTMVVAETWAQRLRALTVQEDGTLAEPRVYADLATMVDPEAHPDGVWPTSNGVWVCTLMANKVVLVRDGEIAKSHDTGDRLPVACTVDEAGGRLFVTLTDTAGLTLGEAIAQKKLSTEVAVFDL
jgi:sugar lactone lactonase YvrE